MKIGHTHTQLHFSSQTLALIEFIEDFALCTVSTRSTQTIHVSRVTFLSFRRFWKVNSLTVNAVKEFICLFAPNCVVLNQHLTGETALKLRIK